MNPKIKQYYAKIRFDSRDFESLLSDHAHDYGVICRQYVINKSRRDKIELEISQEFDRLCGVMRRRLKKKESKPTETSVKQAVNALEAYQELQDEWLELKEVTRHWDVLRDAWGKRGFMISGMVELHIKGLLSKRGSSHEQTYDDRRGETSDKRTDRRRF